MSGVLNLSGSVPRDLSVNSFACNILFARDLPSQIMQLIEEYISINPVGNIITSPGNTTFSVISTVDLPSNNSNIYMYNSAANQGYHLFYDNSANTFRLVDYPTATDVFEADTSNLHLFNNATVDGNIALTGNVTGGSTWQGSTVGAIYGGTGLNTYVLGDLIYASGPNTLARLPANPLPTAYYLMSQNGAAPVWAAGGGGGVTGEPLTVTNSNPNVTLTLSGDPGSALVFETDIEITWTGALSATRGGTGQTVYATGDLLYASATNTLARLAPNPLATPYYLASSNGFPPVWTQLGELLTTSTENNVTLVLSGNPSTALVETVHMQCVWDGVLASSRGGTGYSFFLDGEMLIGNSMTGELTKNTLTAGTNINITNGNGSSTITLISNPTFPRISTDQVILSANGFTTTLNPTPNMGGIDLPIISSSPGWRLFKSASSLEFQPIPNPNNFNTSVIVGSAPNLIFANAASNMINYGTNGQGNPIFEYIPPPGTYVGRSFGTKILLRDTFSETEVDFALGVTVGAGTSQWASVPLFDPSYEFRWYGGETEIMSLTGTGSLTCQCDISVPDLTLSTMVLTTDELSLYGTTSTNSVSISANPNTSAYNLILPNAQGALNEILVNDGSGNLSWGTAPPSSSTLPDMGIYGTAPNLIFANATSNMINFGTSGVGVPTMTTRSPGTKIILRDTLSPTSVDFAIGVDTDRMWFSVPENTNAYNFRFSPDTTLGNFTNISGDGTIDTGYFSVFFPPLTLSNLFYTIIPFSSQTLTVTNGDIIFTSTNGLVLSGGSTLNYYEEYTNTLSVTSGSFAGSLTFNVKIDRIGNIITLMTENFTFVATGSSTNYTTAIGAILPQFVPDYDQYIPINVNNNDISQVGQVVILHNGTLTVYFGINHTDTNNLGNCGHYGFNVSYNL